MKQLYTEKPITQTLEENYLPYAMSVIISRAIPEIDGFKPSHRKLLYTMYKRGLLTGTKMKSANIVGETMKLNPHGDGAIYETMVRLSRGYDALIVPFIDSKGNFGKHFSRDMAYAASRYTEAKLDSICTEIFSHIDSDTVDFVDNYDNTMKEPKLLPTTFPNVLVNANMGIAVSMACSICSFNLKEVCETTIELIKNPEHKLTDTLIAPDFSTGGGLVFSASDMNSIYESGRGTFKLRAKYSVDTKSNRIEITEIPYTTTVEAIVDKIVDLVKTNKIKEINDVRDETDLSGLKLVIELKRGADAEKLMPRLFKMTTLQDVFACNFNILIGNTPRVMGVREILNEWLAFRIECIKRRVFFEMTKKKERLHLLKGLRLILLDIDKAVKIVRETDEDADVIPNLMIGFSIDEIQAEFIAEIKLRNLNKEFILKKIAEIEDLEAQIRDLEETLESKTKVNKIIIKELQDVVKKFAKPRRTDIIYGDEIEEYIEEEHIEDYQVNLFFTKGGYFKKITPLSLRMGGEHKFKEGDEIAQAIESTNKAELLFFTDKHQVYKARASDFDDTKASMLGDFVSTTLKMDSSEMPVFMLATTDYKGYLFIAFKNGKAAKVELASYETKTNRKKLINAYSAKEAPVAFFHLEQEKVLSFTSSNNKVLIADTALVSSKTTKDTAGVAVMTQKGKNYLYKVCELQEGMYVNPDYYKTRNIPAVGSFLRNEDGKTEQLTL